MAALITLRKNLIAEFGCATAADLMMIDAAVVAYYNFLWVQRDRKLVLTPVSRGLAQHGGAPAM